MRAYIIALNDEVKLFAKFKKKQNKHKLEVCSSSSKSKPINIINNQYKLREREGGRGELKKMRYNVQQLYRCVLGM